MALTNTQVHQLKAKLEPKHVKIRKANGADLHYVEGWHVIAEANRIFGFDAWDRRTLATRCVWSGAAGVYHEAAYTAKVRVSVRAGDITITRKDGSKIEGYLFDRRTGASLKDSIVRLYPRNSNDKVAVSYAEIGALAFSGRDTAAGKSWEAWMKKYAEKKAAGEKDLSLHPEALE